MLKQNPWFLVGEHRPQARCRLFCFPFAGGGASAFHGWFKAFPETIEVVGVQPPGRESRLRETALEQSGSLTEAIADALEPELDRPFDLFGYSMGGIIAFEVARELRRRGAQLPGQLFVASRIAPQLPNTHPPLAHLGREAFLDSIRDYFQPPEDAWQHPELLDLLLPTLRADFKICDTYVYSDEPPLNCPIHAFVGEGDRGAPSRFMQDWSRQTDCEFTLETLPGGHFFITSQLAQLQRKLNERIRAFHGLPA